MLYQLSYSREWGGEDLNLRRQLPADLQSAPFGHSGTSPTLELAGGIEPPNLRITNPPLCLLSYTSAILE